MTAAPPPPTGRPLRLAPHVTHTRLPFGGAVLVDGVTLTVAECGERDGELLDRLLAHGLADGAEDPAAREMAARLIADGWLLAPPAGRSTP